MILRLHLAFAAVTKAYFLPRPTMLETTAAYILGSIAVLLIVMLIWMERIARRLDRQRRRDEEFWKRWKAEKMKRWGS